MTEINAGDRSSDQKLIRRRFVQSILFPVNPGESKDAKDVKMAEAIDEGGNRETDGGIRGEKKRKSRGKAAAQPRGSKKVYFNSERGSNATEDGTVSPEDRSPQSLKKKQWTPRRNGRTNGIFRGKIPTHSVASELTSKRIPDLRSEAKMTAEENSRMFAGKQLHPFFSTWKGGKKDQHTDDGSAKCELAKRKEANNEFGPIHVFENVKDDIDSVNWSNWTFYDGPFSNSSCNFVNTTFAFEGAVGSSPFDNILGASMQTSHILKDGSLGYSPVVHDISSILDYKEVVPSDLLKDIEKDGRVENFGFASEDLDCINSDSYHQKAILHKRTKSCYLNRNDHPENSLWTAKYQPERALEVCGNVESVNFVSEWLRLWHERDLRNDRKLCDAAKGFVQEFDSDSCGSDSVPVNIDEGALLKNVLLVKGPVGCGKSAAIYACAKEQGFRVIEVNASDWRNGALVKQKFGEAVGLHWLKRSPQKPVGLQSKHNENSSPSVHTNGAASLDLNNDVNELTPLSYEEDSSDTIQLLRSQSSDVCCQGEVKTLILFEDVDATLSEDRGFISTIQQLADTGKRPMILTSNSENPVLPVNLKREEVSFKMPLLEELLYHVHKICAAEKANRQPDIVERCIQHCQRDTRKTLMHLQFWCQGRSCETKEVSDKGVPSRYGRMLFDLEAGHCVLPKMIPWSFPSQLSDLIEKAITESLCDRDENPGRSEDRKVEIGNINTAHNPLDVLPCKTDVTEAKGALLTRNFFAHDENDLIASNNAFELSNTSGSPVAFSRRHSCIKFDNELSSGCEDEISGVEKFTALGKLSKDVDNCINVPEVDPQFHVSYPAVDVSLNLSSNNQFLHFGEAKVEAIGYHHIPEINVNHDKFPAVNTSLIPSNDKLLHSGWESIEAIQHPHAETGIFNEVDSQYAEAANADHAYYPEGFASFLPFSDHVLHSGEVKMDEIWNQFQGRASVDHIDAPSTNDPFRPFSGLLLGSEDARMECPHQLQETVNVNDIRFSELDDSLDQLNAQIFCHGEGKMHFLQRQCTDPSYQAAEGSSNLLNCPYLQSDKVETEGIQHQYLEIENHVNNRCESIDISCVPEPAMVPETLVNDGIKFRSGADLIETLSPANIGSARQLLFTYETSCDVKFETGSEEMGDSHCKNENTEASTSGMSVMYECSRMDSRERSRCLKKPVAKAAMKSIQETWDILRNSNLTQYVTSEEEDASRVIHLSHGMCNLISEADLLLNNCRLLMNDSLDEEMGFEEEVLLFGWCNQQVQMTSAFAQRGYRLFVREIENLRSKMGLDIKLHLDKEMRPQTSNSVAFREPFGGYKGRSENQLAEKSLKMAASTTNISFKSEKQTRVHDILRSIVPSRLYLALRGDAFHEYLSSLAHISRLEASRLSENIDRPKRRRGRVANYLSSAIALSPDDISELIGYDSYKVSTIEN